MHNITYISTVDRKRLVVLNEAVRGCETSEELQDVRDEIAAIESKRKPLSECDLNECTELRSEIWDKFDRLNRTGKFSLAQQFKVMLRQIEMHQAQVIRQTAIDDASRKLADRDGKTRLVSDTSNMQKAKSDKSDTKTKSQSVSSRWTTGIGNLD